MDATPFDQKRGAEERAAYLIASVDPTDRWAMSCIAHAISYIAIGWYRLARVELEDAVAPLEERSPTEEIPDKYVFPKEELEKALAFVRGIPAREF